MTLIDKLIAISNCFNGLGVPVLHYWHPIQDAPMLIWAEDGVETFSADNHTAEQAVTGSLDYFTKVEFDRNIDLIQDCLSANMDGWVLESIQYEDNTNMIHYEWRWSFVG